MWIDLLTTYVKSKYMETIIQYSLYFAQRNTTGVFCLVLRISNTHLSLHVINGKAVYLCGGGGDLGIAPRMPHTNNRKLWVVSWGCNHINEGKRRPRGRTWGQVGSSFSLDAVAETQICGKNWSATCICLFDVCVSVHHMWNWREIPTWWNNLFIIINNSTCFGHLYAHLQEY